MMSFTTEIQRPVYWTSVTSCFVLLAAICCCNGVPYQKTSNLADPLRGASESSRIPDTTEQPDAMAVDLGSLLDAGEHAVVTLVAGHTRLAAHRAVLAAGSLVLAAMFRPDMLEASNSEVDIPDVEGPVLRQLVAYLYTGRVPQLPGMALQLLAAADKYSLNDLKDACEQQVLKQLDVENAAAAAVVALKHSCQNLRKAAIAFIKSHIFEVLTTRGWAEGVHKHPGEVVQITGLLAETPAETSATTTADGTTTATAAPAASTATPATADSTSTPTAIVTAAPIRCLCTPSPQASAVSHLRTTAAAHRMPTLTAGPAATTATPTTGESTTTATTAPTTAHADTTATPSAAKSTPTPTAATPATPTAAAQPHSDLGQTAATALLPTVGPPTPTPDAAQVSRLRSLSGVEKARQLIRAAQRGSVEEVRALVAAGADVESRGGASWTALDWAADYGHTAVVRLLLAASADPNARDHNGWTPLHWAADRGRAEAAAALLGAGADRRATDKWGRTALDLARGKNHSQLIQMLL